MTSCPDLEAAILTTWEHRPELKGNALGTARAVLAWLELPATRLHTLRRLASRLATGGQSGQNRELMFDVGAEDAQGASEMSDESKGPDHGRGYGTPHMTRRRAATAQSPASLVGRDCEVRSSGGSITRGELVAVRDGWATLELHTGRTAVIRLASVVAIVAESGSASVAKAGELEEDQ